MPPRIVCDLCNRPVSPHGHYIVKIDVYADPEMPAVSSEELAEADYQQAMKELMEQMKGMTADELQDQVHRRFEFKLCRTCQMRFLVNPLGKPRQHRPGSN
jgi:predicted amidophosphoribosyltransferase